jgi:hypothetical protein
LRSCLSSPGTPTTGQPPRIHQAPSAKPESVSRGFGLVPVCPFRKGAARRRLFRRQRGPRSQSPYCYQALSRALRDVRTPRRAYVCDTRGRRTTGRSRRLNRRGAP